MTNIVGRNKWTCPRGCASARNGCASALNGTMKCHPGASEGERQDLRVRLCLDVLLRLDVPLRPRAPLLLLVERSWRHSRELRLSFSSSEAPLVFPNQQYYRRPPAMRSVSPVIHFESSEAKNTAARSEERRVGKE